jgi:sulfopyruvate decarboxylase TPP-binding subunit
MFDGPSVLAALRDCGVSHVVWIPDSETGRWEQALAGAPDLALVRVCREGEAIGVAAGLLLGGKTPVVVMQCTGLFEAGDALRNIVHDLRLPLFLIVGVRNLRAHRRGASSDSCPVFSEPFLQAWRLPYLLLEESQGVADLAGAYRQARRHRQPFAVLLPE